MCTATAAAAAAAAMPSQRGLLPLCPGVRCRCAVPVSRTRRRLKGTGLVVLNHHDPVVVQTQNMLFRDRLGHSPDRRFHNNTDKGGCTLCTAVKKKKKRSHVSELESRAGSPRAALSLSLSLCAVGTVGDSLVLWRLHI